MSAKEGSWRARSEDTPDARRGSRSAPGSRPRPRGQGHSPNAQVGRLSNSSVPDSLGSLRTHTKAGYEPTSVRLTPAVYTSCIHHAGALPGQEGTTLFP